MPNKIDDLASCVHPYIEMRREQLYANLLLLQGGRPYIDHRLSRFPAESAVQWAGANARNSNENNFGVGVEAIHGRKDRAYLTNYARRIVEKVGQYIFATPPERAGIDEDWADNVTATESACTINRFMRSVLHSTFTGGWSWILVDGDMLPEEATAADEQASRVWWSCLDALSVPDFKVGKSGIEMLITERHIYHGGYEPKAKRTIYTPESITTMIVTGRDKYRKVSEVEEMPNRLGKVPAVMVGEAKPCAHAFDDIENIQRSILDMESANDQSLFQMVYPQLVVPAAFANPVGADGTPIPFDGVVGTQNAIVETPEDKGIARFITPNATDLGILREELEKKKLAMFETAGYAMRQETRQVESAEAKAWSHLDIQQALSEWADTLEAAETKAVELSTEVLGSFSAYEPVYNRRFDVTDVESDIKALMGIDTLDLPDSMRREIATVALSVLNKVESIPPERMAAIEAEIAEMATEDLTATTPVSVETEDNP